MRLSCLSLLPIIVSAFQPAIFQHLRTRTTVLRAVDMAEGSDSESKPPVKVTIRKRQKPPDEETAEQLLKKLRAAAAAAEASDGGLEASPVFICKFDHVKPSLATLLKFWLMGGCGAKGWSGTGELEAQHTSGPKAMIEIDADQSAVTLIALADDSYNSKVQLSRYATALLDELEGLAKTEEAAPADRLCYPPEAVDTARASLVPPARG